MNYLGCVRLTAERTVRVGNLEGSTVASNGAVQEEDLVFGYHPAVW